MSQHVFDIPGTDAKRTIVVRGFHPPTTDETLRLFFKSKRRSGGGEIATIDIDRDNNVFTVTYVDPGVAECVLSKGELTLEGATLEVSSAQDVWDGKTIEVSGIKSSTTDDAIELFFESKRRCGGDTVEKVQRRDTDNKVTLVTFENTEVAERVLQNNNLCLDGATLTIRRETGRHHLTVSVSVSGQFDLNSEDVGRCSSNTSTENFETFSRTTSNDNIEPSSSKPSTDDIEPNSSEPSIDGIEPNSSKTSTDDIEPNSSKPSTDDIEPNSSKPSTDDIEPNSSKTSTDGIEPNSSKPSTDNIEPNSSKPSTDDIEPNSSKPSTDDIEPNSSKTSTDDIESNSSKASTDDLEPSPNNTSTDESVCFPVKTITDDTMVCPVQSPVNDNVSSRNKTTDYDSADDDSFVVLDNEADDIDSGSSKTAVVAGDSLVQTNDSRVDENVSPRCKTTGGNSVPSHNETTDDDLREQSRDAAGNIDPCSRKTSSDDAVPSHSETTVDDTVSCRNEITVDSNVPRCTETTVDDNVPSRTETTVDDNVPSRTETTVDDNVPSRNETTGDGALPHDGEPTVVGTVPSRGETEGDDGLRYESKATVGENISCGRKNAGNSNKPYHDEATSSDVTVESCNTTTEEQHARPAAPAHDEWDGKTIEVCGIKSSTTEDAIQLFFESKRRSGGDTVDKMKRDTDNYVTIVTFGNTEVADRVLKKASLCLDDAALTVRKATKMQDVQVSLNDFGQPHHSDNEPNRHMLHHRETILKCLQRRMHGTGKPSRFLELSHRQPMMPLTCSLRANVVVEEIQLKKCSETRTTTLLL